MLVTTKILNNIPSNIALAILGSCFQTFHFILQSMSRVPLAWKQRRSYHHQNWLLGEADDKKKKSEMKLLHHAVPF